MVGVVVSLLGVVEMVVVVVAASLHASMLAVACRAVIVITVHLSEGRGQNNQQPTPNDNNK